MELKEHELSKIIPSMSEEEYLNLREDIKNNGLINPIVLFEEQILDGRHRFRACRELEIEIKVNRYNGNQPLTYIISQNIKRRHLTQSQLAAISHDLMPKLKDEAKKRQQEHGRTAPGKQKSPVSTLTQVSEGKSREQASKLLGVSTGYITEAEAIYKVDKELHNEIREGKKSIPEAKLELAKEEYKKKISTIKTKMADIPKGKYHCIVVDPPWPMKFIKRTESPEQFGMHYPTMTIEQIKEGQFDKDFNIKDLTFKDCHLYLWTTHTFLPYSFGIVKAWGFEYKCLMTWIKNVGFTPYSWMYTTEHILFCTKGNLPLLKRGMRLDFSAKVREHSRKPDEFYELIKKASPEPRIDVFGREKRDGFEIWGKESEKFNGNV